MRALSIRQPWAWLIVHGHKDVENRSWPTSYRGPLIIHASATVARSYYEEAAAEVERSFGITVPPLAQIERGGVVGMADLVDCVHKSESRWWIPDSCAFVLANARPLPFKPYRGALSFFHIPAAELGLAAHIAEETT